MSLSPRPGQVDDDDALSRPMVGATAMAWAIACADSSAGMMPSVRGQPLQGRDRLGVGDGDVLRASSGVQVARAPGRPRDSRGRRRSSAPARIWPSSSCEHVGLLAVQDADRAAADRRRVAPGLATPSPAASTPTIATPASPMNGWKSPWRCCRRRCTRSAQSGSRPSRSRICARASMPMTDWKSRTIIG